MGGGGRTQTSESGVPDWARPYIEDAAKEAQELRKTGQLSQVAGLSDDQKLAQGLIRDQAATAGELPGYATDAFKGAAEGTGIFGTGAYGDVSRELKPEIDRQIQGALGTQRGEFANAGVLGGARAQAASAGAAGNIASQLAAQEVAARRQGALQGAQAGVGATGQAFSQQAAANQALVRSGTEQQQQQQNELDAAYQGVQRFFGLVNPNTVGQKTVQKGGGK